MRRSFKVGLSFGTTSGIITTLGLIVGLYAGTRSQLAILGGILTIAIADAFSDALGIHISEESQKRHTLKQVWESTGATLVSKFVFAAIFIIPVILLDLRSAVMVSVAIGAVVLGVLSYFIAKIRNIEPWRAIFEHLFIAGVVVALTHYVGTWVALTFG